MSGPKKPTPASALRPKQQLITIPGVFDAEGEPLCLLVRAPRIADVLRVLEGIPDGVSPTPTVGSMVGVSKEYEQWNGLAKDLVSLAVIEPRFSFGEPEEGCADWNVLTLTEQMAVVQTITGLVGLSPGRTQGLRTFRDGEEGRPAGDSGGAAGAAEGGAAA